MHGISTPYQVLTMLEMNPQYFTSCFFLQKNKIDIPKIYSFHKPIKMQDRLIQPA